MTSTKRRFGRFSAVGILGAGVQLLLQSLLTRGLEQQLDSRAKDSDGAEPAETPLCTRHGRLSSR